jgi:hypothetical protein
MKKIYLKTSVIFVIIIFLTSPIILSTSNKTLSNQSYSEPIREIRFNMDPDPKIVAAIEMINESYLIEILTALTVNIGPRRTGTNGCEEAAKYLCKELESKGLKTRYHEWSKLTGKLRKLRFFNSENVEATIPGKGDLSDELVTVNAHYDTVEVSPGAVDDGSGVAAVVAAANALNYFEFNRTLKFVLFSGEEVGLLGSSAYVQELYKNGTDILAEFNADMVGVPNEAHTIRISTSDDVDWIFNEIEIVNEIYDIGLDVSRAGRINTSNERGYSDYWDFLLHGYECVAFWQSGSSPYDHSPNDTIDKINFSYLVNVTKLIAAILAHIADIEVYYPQIAIESPKRGRIYLDDLTLRKYKYLKTLVFDDVLICTNVKQGSVPIEKVEFYYDGELMFTDTEEPYQWRLNKFSLIKKHAVKVILYDELGRKAHDKVVFRYINIRLDTKVV